VDRAFEEMVVVVPIRAGATAEIRTHPSAVIISTATQKIKKAFSWAFISLSPRNSDHVHRPCSIWKLFLSLASQACRSIEIRTLLKIMWHTCITCIYMARAFFSKSLVVDRLSQKKKALIELWISSERLLYSWRLVVGTSTSMKRDGRASATRAHIHENTRSSCHIAIRGHRSRCALWSICSHFWMPKALCWAGWTIV
jgi:hypothetical protein